MLWIPTIVFIPTNCMEYPVYAPLDRSWQSFVGLISAMFKSCVCTAFMVMEPQFDDTKLGLSPFGVAQLVTSRGLNRLS